MSGDGAVTLTWGDGETTFRLRIKELRELEDKRNAGAFEIWMRLVGTGFRIDDITEVLRLGLIGAGVPAMLAHGLVAKYVTPGTLLPNVLAARRVLQEGVVGPETDVVGKWIAQAAATLLPAEPDSPNTSAPAPQWDGTPDTSMNAHSGNSLQP